MSRLSYLVPVAVCPALSLTCLLCCPSDLLLLLAPIAHHIPEPLTIYFNTDDVPRFIASYQVLNASTTYGAQASLWPQEDRETLEAAQKGTWGWYWACGRETPVGRRFRDAILEEEHIGGTSNMLGTCSQTR